MTETKPDIVGRVQVLEHSVERLEHVVEKGFSDLAKNVQRLIETPRSLPFKEVLVSVCTTAAIMHYVFTAGNSWFDQRIAPMAQSVQRIVDQDKNGDIAVLKYRVQQLEAIRVAASK